MRQHLAVIDTANPTIRHKLKAAVHIAGYPTYAELANSMGMHPTQLSRILNGREHPSPMIQRRLANELGLSLKELKDLL
jgi:transcriptional regulator with XRE-family HTH domain